MALLFNADTELVNYGSDASIDNMNPLTVMAVVRRGETGSNHQIFDKSGSSDTGMRFRITDFPTDGTLDLLRKQSGTNAAAIASDGALAQDTWYIVFFVYTDETTQVKIFSAALGSVLTERTYGVQTTPSGTITTDAAHDLLIGHNPSITSRSFVGDIAEFACMEAALTLAQCKAVSSKRVNMLNHSCRVWSILGWNGTGTQGDYSGSGITGAVTGATLSDHPGLPHPWPVRVGWQGAFTAAAGGRIMSSLAATGSLAGSGGIAGAGGGLAG